MDKIRYSKRLVVMGLAVLAMVLAVSAPSAALGMAGHGFGGGHAVADMHHGFDGHHGFDRQRHFGFVYPYYGYYPPVYGYQAPAYWYYCPSYGAYYPNVTSCPDAWVQIPAY